ncbi:hypothetical protein PSECIP111951_03070 [Pseudoalteromonas holothuriae]|uniref:LPS-assembly protein LptD n=1 Tax=Pseudoalteromonas holothuriae TaxID=2963714 RepID=A0ABN8UP12_9GAMM|nr:hypothetical protein [Pseudoalteromonas sp. CIP111951]CAH9064191.1 hypothetical protein PSECIP111951_03070 [Pseudoalteromonas sp. CIP111951]
MLKALTLTFIILAYCTQATAFTTPIHSAMLWLDSIDNNPLLVASKKVTLNPQQHRTAYVPAGAWVDISKDTFTTTNIWQGQTQAAMRKLTINDFICQTKRCQLRAINTTQLVKFSNISDDTQHYDIWLGQTHAHRSPFRRSLKLSLPVIWLSQAQIKERMYFLAQNTHTTLFFAHAKKLKLTVRKDLDHQLEQRSSVSAWLGTHPISILNLPNAQAIEYPEHNISIANTDYIDVPKNSYLTIKSHGNAYIKLEQLHRGIVDTDAALKYKDKLFNPFWVNNLDQSFAQIYLHNNYEALTQFDFANTSDLEKKRYQNLLSTISTPRSLIPTHNGSSMSSNLFTQKINLGVRTANNQLYPIQSTDDVLVHSLDTALTFNWSHLTRIRHFITLLVQTDKQTQLVVTTGKQQHVIALNQSNYLNRILLPVPLNSKQLHIQKNHNAQVDIALKADDLLTYPNNELLFGQPSLLQQKSPALMQHFLNQRKIESLSYINRLKPYKNKILTNVDTTAVHNKQLKLVNEQRMLGEALHFIDSQPEKALPLLKKLVSSTFLTIRHRAWPLRINTLNKLKQYLLSQSYLEGLLRSDDLILKEYAAHTLFDTYTQAQSDHQLLGLCAYAESFLSTCNEQTASILLSQKKYLQTLWQLHDQPNSIHKKAVSFQALQYKIFGQTHLQPKEHYFLEHHGVTTVKSDNTLYAQYLVSPDHPLTLTAKQDLTIEIRSRVNWHNQNTHHTEWLYLNTQDRKFTSPIFADIASSTFLYDQNTRLCVASNRIITLRKGHQLKLSSTSETYLSLNLLPDDSATLNTNTQLYPNKSLLALINSPDISLATLLTNALWQLEMQRVSEHEFTMLFARLTNEEIPESLDLLYKKVQRFGDWQASKGYVTYAGTKLIDLAPLLKRSLTEQISFHASSNPSLDGVTLRANHTLTLDIGELSKSPLKIQFNFSNADWSPSEHANISIEAGDKHVLWPVEPGPTIDYALKMQDQVNRFISLRWLNPYIAQIVTVRLLSHQGGKWVNIPLDTKQLFYSANNEYPITLKIKRDQLLKIESIKDNKRVQRTLFHPSGTVTLPDSYAQYTRVFHWRLKPTHTKLAIFNPVQPIITKQPKPQHNDNQTVFFNNAPSFDENSTHTEAFMRYGRSNLVEINESLNPDHTLDLGIRVRNKDKQHWYRLEGAVSMNSNNYDTLSLNAIHNWQDNDSHWFSEAALFNRWQGGRAKTQSQYAGLARLRIGEIWRNNTTHRHQWWWQPFYYYTSVDTQTFIDDSKINPQIFGFYRQDHMHGWQAEYKYRYQPWVDNQISFVSGTISNQDWQTLDSIYFSSTMEQFYQGHIFAAQLQSRYKFADEDRPNDTWQYLTKFSWQTLFTFTDTTAGWLALSWTKDWFNVQSSLSLEVRLGNLQTTGFATFAHDEILFESLQLSSFIEQSAYDNQ